mgnify:CR=1 FL=1
MSELFREIQEDIRRERFDKIWRSVGRFAVWGSIALIAATTVYVVWDNYTQRQVEAKTAQLLRGTERLNSSDYKGAIPIFSAMADDNESSYYSLAMLQKAAAQELNGDSEAAKKTYLALVKHQSGKDESKLSEQAKLKIAENNAAIEVSKDSPFYHTLAEQNAWHLLKSGKKSEAAEVFANLVNDKDSPRTLVERSSAALHIIAPEKLGEKSLEKKVINE